MHLNESKENEQQQIVQQQAIQCKESNQNTSFKDNRPEAIYQRKMQDMTNNSSRVMQLQAMQEMANKGYQSRSIFQRKESNNDNLNFPIQRKENKTGLPDNLKSGIENLSGHSMDDVKVHYNSDKPAQLQAHAYAQGTDIHLGAGQEKHLPHEAWHVVQQKQGRVKPTMQMKGKVNVNDDSGLEREADVMGAKALQMKGDSENYQNKEAKNENLLQLKCKECEENENSTCENTTDEKLEKTELEEYGKEALKEVGYEELISLATQHNLLGKSQLEVENQVIQKQTMAVFNTYAATAGVTSQLDSPLPGIADLVALGILAIGLIHQGVVHFSSKRGRIIKIRCTKRFTGGENPPAHCPDRVYGEGTSRGEAQRNAKNTAPAECRKFYGHCGPY